MNGLLAVLFLLIYFSVSPFAYRTKRRTTSLPRHQRQNVLWPEDVKCPIVVGLAGLDRIVPTRPLRRYLLSHGDFATTTAKSIDGPTGVAGSGRSNPSIGRAAAARNGLGRPGGGFALMNGNSRRKVHTCNVGGKHTGHGTRHFPAPCPSGGGGGLSSAASSGSIRPDSQGGVRRPTAKAAGSGGGGSDKGGGGAAKRVELVYWSDAGHGNVLGDPWALDEFVRVSTRQEEAFLVK